MFVVIDGVQHRISFFHGVGEFEFESKDPLTQEFVAVKEVREFCKCFITTGMQDNRVQVSEGISICHPNDTYEKERGRKIALTDALTSFEDREIRRRFWDAYLNRKTAAQGELQPVV